MKKITRFLFCTFVAIMLMGTAISATACHQKEEYPSVPEVTEPQPTGEIIPTVDRQKELKDARRITPMPWHGCICLVPRWTTP